VLPLFLFTPRATSQRIAEVLFCERFAIRYCGHGSAQGGIMIRLAVFSLAALVVGGAAFADTPVERGSYLVNTIMTCGNCHSPKGPPDVVAGKDFSGGLRFDEPPFDVTAPNITSDKETGIGTWSTADIKKLLLDNVRPTGVSLVVMPTGFYRILLPSDLDAIVAYLQSVKPINNKVPGPIYKMPVEHQIFPGAEKPIDPADLNDRVKRGFYLATIGHCMECHTPMVKGVEDFKGALGAGGREFPGPWGVSISANITSSKTKGIGTWTDAEVKRAINQGIDKDGKKLKGPMGYQYYAHMTDADLDAVIAWLRTVPPKE
jgi:mono/diheme cytochrome c family protein